MRHDLLRPHEVGHANFIDLALCAADQRQGFQWVGSIAQIRATGAGVVERKAADAPAKRWRLR
jgi:hypothetical protein